MRCLYSLQFCLLLYVFLYLLYVFLSTYQNLVKRWDGEVIYYGFETLTSEQIKRDQRIAEEISKIYSAEKIPADNCGKCEKEEAYRNKNIADIIA